MTRSKRVWVACAAVSVLLAACSTTSETSTDDTAAQAPEASTSTSTTTVVGGEPESFPPGTFEFTVGQETFVDESRTTPAGAETPEEPARTLVTDVYVPDRDGPAPLIVFAHGLTGIPAMVTEVAGTWASAGYVVAVPAFPLTSRTVPGAVDNFADVVNQPSDVSFLIDQLVGLSDDAASEYAGTIDARRIGVGGHSLGGMTVYRGGVDTCCRDQRVGAVLVFASAAPADLVAPEGIPTLVLHGDMDASLPIDLGLASYEKLTAPRYFVTLIGGDHVSPYEDAPSAYDELVNEGTTVFWNTYLLGSADGPSVAEVFEVDGLTTVIYEEA